MADQMGVTPPPMGIPPTPMSAAPGGFVNNSGQPGAMPPPELQGWSWAGFLMNWIWAIAHSAWIGLVLCLLTGPIGMIIQGVKGNEWAWQGRRWENVEQFKATEAVWVKWGVILLIVGVLLGIVGSIVGGIIAASAMHQAALSG